MAIVELQESAPIAGEGPAGAPPADPALQPGTRVEVRRRFDAKWARGFEVLDHASGEYQLRRLSDGSVLPVSFPEGDVRVERRNNTWWI